MIMNVDVVRLWGDNERGRVYAAEGLAEAVSVTTGAAMVLKQLRG